MSGAKWVVGLGCAALLTFSLAGCQAPKPIYYWGNYETSLYTLYSKPGKLDLETQAKLLEEDLAHAREKNLSPNPGLHAQLGFVFVQMGRVDDARREFNAEKALFPESAVLMDRMLAKLGEQKT